MPSTTLKRATRQFVTMYAPIFRDKLEKLERRGQGHTEEARRLRTTLARIETAQRRPQEDGALLSDVA